MTLLNAGARDVATTCLAALKHVLSDVHAYHGNKHDYDNLDNADLACVIDNSKGLPIALAILYIHAGRAQGWSIDALNMPGHVLCRIEHNAERVIVILSRHRGAISSFGCKIILNCARSKAKITPRLW